MINTRKKKEISYLFLLIVSIARHLVLYLQEYEFRLDNQSEVSNLGIETQTCKPVSLFDQKGIQILLNHESNQDSINLTESFFLKSVSGTDIIERSVKNDEWMIEAVKSKRSEYGFF